MVRWHPDTNGLRVAQDLFGPCVYLDHCALRKISESEPLTKRFVSGLLTRGGTLALSWLNILEFCKVTVDEQRLMAARLLKHVGVNVFWLNPDFFTVGQRENMHTGNENVPVADMKMACVYLRAIDESDQQGTIAPLLAFFDAVIKTPTIRGQFDDLGRDIISKFQDFREDNALKVNLRKPSRRNKPLDVYGTKIIARELIACVIKNCDVKLIHNNAIDLTHAVVASSYCDYVILDKQWATWINQLRRRLSASGIAIPLAAAIPVSETELFLREWEEGPQFR